MENKVYTEEQMADIKERIQKAQENITAILKENQLVITSEPIYIKLETGIFATSFKIGYLDTKFNEQIEQGVEGVEKTPEEGPVIEE